MKRRIIKIDEEKCNGCGLCVPACHEGALQIINGKAVLVSELMCDGLGDCIGFCPEGAITFEEESHRGCPGSASRVLTQAVPAKDQDHRQFNRPFSALTHWPVQMHLINPRAGHFHGSDLLLAADCTAFTLGNFHGGFLAGKTLAIACPKLDSNRENYIDKLQVLIDESQVNTLTVMVMEVPCCNGLLQIAQMALSRAKRRVPVKEIVISVDGKVKQDQWQMF
ncbi:MAG: 4Fe-4S binding protein [Bacteroidales bacterium]